MIDAIREYFQLLYLRIAVSIFNFAEFIKVIGRFYFNKLFRKIDLSLLRKYLFKNPFKISKQFLKDRGEKDVYAYGETPITMFAEVVKRLSITPTDQFIELGCGRGRCCFWLNAFKPCQVVGIEWIPSFVDIANQIKDDYQLKNIHFLCEDMLQSDFSKATIVFLYGTSLEDEIINSLIEKFKELPIGSRIVTVSYPLTDYSQNRFRVTEQFTATFPWGTTDIYIQQKL